MKLRPISAFMLLGLLASVLSDSATAQVPMSNVGVIDIAEVFKAHRQFNAELEAMKQDVELFKQNLQREQERLRGIMEAAQLYDVNSAEFKEREAEFTSEMARLELFRNQQNREFLEREARLYFETYVAVSRQLASMSEEFGLTLVLRVDNKAAESTDRNSVLQFVNRNIVYKAADRDFTSMLIDRVNR